MRDDFNIKKRTNVGRHLASLNRLSPPFPSFVDSTRELDVNEPNV